MNIVIQEYIAIDPKIRAGRPVIAGTGIRVMEYCGAQKLS